MKKILAIALSVVMLLSLGVVFASADDAAGFYCGGSEDSFSPVGDITINWDADASSKLDLSDGDMSDWSNAGYNVTPVGPAQMISWVGGSADNQAGGVPEGWGFQCYFVADKDYLYIGFYVTDPFVKYAPSAATYTSGDAFQFSVDFDRALGKMIEADPELFANQQSIFYSFSILAADPTPIQIQVQHNDNEGVITEESAPHEGMSEDGVPMVKGTTAQTNEGWCAEFAMSWEMLHFDFAYRTYEEGYVCDIWEDDPLEVNCALYYLDHSSDTSGITWAAGTLDKQEAGVAPLVTWAPADLGMNLYLPYDPNMEFSCEYIQVLGEGETPAPETEAPTVEETEAPTEAPTQAPETEAPTDAETQGEAGTNASEGEGTKAEEKEGGCGSVIGSVAVLFSAMAAAVVLKKKD